MSFQMGKQHFDFLTSPSAFIVCRRVFQIADGLACIFIHVPRDRSERRVGTGLADRTCAAGFLASEVALDAVILLDPAQGQLVPLKAGEAVPACVILEVTDVIFSVRLMLAVQHWNVRRDIAFQQPCQKRAGAV